MREMKLYLRRLTGATAVVTLASALISAGTGHALAVESRPTQSTSIVALTQLEQQQAPLAEVADRIEIAAATISGDSGITNIAVDVERSIVNVYWKGAIPEEVQAEIDRAGEAGTEVNVLASDWSREEIYKQSDTLLRSTTPEVVSTIEGTVAGDGLVVGVNNATLSPTGKVVGLNGDELDRRQQSVEDSPTFANSPIPITFEQRAPVAPTIGRYNDTTPFRGGASYYNLTANNICSTGFGIQRRTFPAEKFLLTAAHCFDTRTPAQEAMYTYNPLRNTYGPSYLGPGVSAPADESQDAAVIATGSSGSQVYMGGIDPNFETALVFNAASNPTGILVATSGGYSGERGSIRIESSSASWSFRVFNRLFVMRGARGYRTDGASAVGPGDSGGPVVSNEGYSGTTRLAAARGVISAQDTNYVACTGIPATQRSRPCSATVYYGSIIPILDSLGMNLN